VASKLLCALQRLGFPEVLKYKQIFVIFTAVDVVCLVLFSLLKEVKPDPHVADYSPLSEEDVKERRLLLKWSGVVALD
jgi:hypothetical protein